MTLFELNHVVPLPMSDVAFSAASLWKNKTTISKANTIIISPSGSGKTSLFSFLNGLRSNYSGEILWKGKNIKSFSLKEWSLFRQTNASTILQDLRLLPQLTVEENLLLKNQLTNFKTVDEIKALVAAVGLQDKWHQSCGTLSYGQQQRIAIVRSLLQPFELLIADEPFSHLDDNNIAIAKELMLSECKKQGSALILFSLGQTYGIPFTNQLEL